MQHTVSLKQNHEFRRLYNRGKSAVSPYFAIYCRKTGRDYSRLGITTGVKLGNAVKRNFVRRRIRALYRTNEAGLQPGYDIVVVARTRAIFGRYADLERSFRQLTRKLGLTLGSPADAKQHSIILMEAWPMPRPMRGAPSASPAVRRNSTAAPSPSSGNTSAAGS